MRNAKILVKSSWSVTKFNIYLWPKRYFPSFLAFISLKSVLSLHSKLESHEIIGEEKATLNQGKGRWNSEWIDEVIVSPKMPTKNLKNFCPGSLRQKSFKFLVGILGETMIFRVCMYFANLIKKNPMIFQCLQWWVF